MEPKDKAKELVEKMFNVDLDCENEAMCMLYPHAVRCALVTVDETISVCKQIQKLYHDNDMINSDIDWQPEEYWQEVKQEIIKL